MQGILDDCPAAATILLPSVYLIVIVLVTRVSALMSSVGAEYPTEQQVEAMVAKVKECTRGGFRVGKLKE